MALSRLRLRLAGGFALAFTVALAILAIGALGYLWRESRTRLDVRLAVTARGVADAVKREVLETPDSTLAYAVDEVLREWPDARDEWVVIGEGDEIIATTDSAYGAPLIAGLGLKRSGEQRPRGPEGLRVSAVVDSVVIPSAHVYRYRVLAIGSTSGIKEDTETLAGALTIAAPLIVLLSVMAGYLLAGRVLRPVRDLGQAIAAVDPTKLDQRVHVGASRDEVSALAERFNQLLERLQATQTRNRAFIQMAAHQIRTPLTLVLGESDLDNLAGPVSDNAGRQAMKRIGVAAEQMRRRVDELFLLAEAEAGSTIPLDSDVELDGLVLECTDLMRARAANAGHLLALGTIEPAVVRGNASLLREALIELLENACRHGTATAPILTEVRYDDACVILSVVNASSVREPGTTTGSQLGLRIVRWIAEGHGGTVDVHSEQHDDGTFSHRSLLRLPVCIGSDA